MSFNDRPNPDEILEAIKLEEAQRNKGRLKIFLGMAAGVGKTYSMLEEAQVLRKEQVDVVVGNVEAHGRAETEILLRNLPRIPQKSVFYKDKEFKELDVEAIIRLKPSIVLVDELAHTNIPGSKHAKRWQDVLEILDQGIDVHTTLNVQHIDSLNDIVWGITEIVVRETVPDLIIEQAHSIQLIDLTPDELLQRLKEGKVYLEEQSKIASLHFFQKDKLTALREIVLRYVADKIDVDLRRAVSTKEGRIDWKTREKFLVAINQSPDSQKLIRTTRRLATQANAPWVAVYVDTGKTLNKEDDELLEKNFTLTRGLGAEVVTIHDPDIAEGIKRVAYQRGITQIILGRTPKNVIFSLFQGPTLQDTLASECKEIDLHIMRQDKYAVPYRKSGFSFSWRSKYSDYLYASLSVSLMAILSWIAIPFLSYRIVQVLFIIGIVALSAFFKRGPIVLAAILYGIIWSFLFYLPVAGLGGRSAEDFILLVLYVLTAMGIGVLVDKAREQRELLSKGDKKAFEVSEILRGLDSNLALHDISLYIQESLPKVLEGTYNFAFKNKEGGIDLDAVPALVADNKERMTALWAFDNAQEAGWSTDTMPLSQYLYIPLKKHHEVLGVLIYGPQGKRLLSLEDRNLLYNMSRQLTNAFESASAL